jgi:hypothetical protein
MNTSSSFAGITTRRKMPKRTKSGRKTKIASFEEKVKASSLPGGEREKYAIANKIGLKRGSKTTAKGMKPARRKG